MQLYLWTTIRRMLGWYVCAQKMLHYLLLSNLSRLSKIADRQSNHGCQMREANTSRKLLIKFCVTMGLKFSKAYHINLNRMVVRRDAFALSWRSRKRCDTKLVYLTHGGN